MPSPLPVSGARVEPAQAPYEPSIAELFNSIMPAGMEPLVLFRTMARNPRVLQRMFAGNLLDRGAITLREREILILRTCARCGCEYEWGVHVSLFAQHAALTPAEIAATLEPQTDTIWPEGDADLIRLADELHEQATVTDPLWAELAQHRTVEQLLEMIALCGYYHSISFTANAARLAPEAFAARFTPPHSAASASPKR
jgi:hypothetical protein